MYDQKEILKGAAKNLGISHFPQDVQEKILMRLGENITKRIMLELLKNLPEEKMGEFEELQKSGDDEKMQTFLRANVQNVDEIVHNAAQRTIADIKARVGVKSKE